MMKDETLYNRMAEDEIPVLDTQESNTNIEETKSTSCMGRPVINSASVEIELGNSSEEYKKDYRNKAGLWVQKVKQQLLSTYTKRNPFVNALLSLFLLSTIILSILTACGSLLTFISAFLSVFTTSSTLDLMLSCGFVMLGLSGIFYSVSCIYYMYEFIGANRKKSIIYAFTAFAGICFIILTAIIILSTPETDDDTGSFLASVIISFFLSVLSCILCFCFVYMVMKIKKYGATAWSLLEVSRIQRSKSDKKIFVLYFLCLLVPTGLIACEEYLSAHPVDKYPSHATAKVGDFYYTDGTISSELLPDKEAVGIVFSLEPSEVDKTMGYSHGQIVALSDITAKMSWDETSLKDYDKYPNYTWKNRMSALDDINGIAYTNCEGYICLDISNECMQYMGNEVKGISEWYLPTAGQWAKIIENIGGAKVDSRLKFDSAKASDNLKKIGINPQQWYWTITEFDAENAWSIRIANGEFGSHTYKQNEASVRPVTSF